MQCPCDALARTEIHRRVTKARVVQSHRRDNAVTHRQCSIAGPPLVGIGRHTPPKKDPFMSTPRSRGCSHPARRELLLAAASASLTLTAMPAIAQSPSPARGAGDRIRVAHLLDASPDQQEISRDYATGVRLAVNDFNRSARRGLQLVNFESDGSAASVRAQIESIRKDASLCALLGTAGERLALESIAAARAQGLSIAHVAPWLSDTRHDRDRDVVTLFASREAQLLYALKSLEAIGIAEIGLVYASARDFESLHGGVERVVESLTLRSAVFAPRSGEDIAALAGRIGSASPIVMLFLGETIELSQFMQALSARRLQRYIVSLADIDVGTLMQLGVGRAVPLILTQVVPNPQTSNLPAVRDAFDRRSSDDVGGFQIGFDANRQRGSAYVTQTLLKGDGKLIG